MTSSNFKENVQRTCTFLRSLKAQNFNSHDGMKFITLYSSSDQFALKDILDAMVAYTEKGNAVTALL